MKSSLVPQRPSRLRDWWRWRLIATYPYFGENIHLQQSKPTILTQFTFCTLILPSWALTWSLSANIACCRKWKKLLEMQSSARCWKVYALLMWTPLNTPTTLMCSCVLTAPVCDSYVQSECHECVCEWAYKHHAIFLRQFCLALWQQVKEHGILSCFSLPERTDFLLLGVAI